MTTLKQKVGLAVRMARKRYKDAKLTKAGMLTQEGLAAKAKVSMETISNVERGATLPTIDVLFKIARVLPLDLAELAESLPTDDSLSKDRVRLEGALAEIAQGLSDDKLKSLIEIARVLEREGA
jgi:transcriptional regulator with XRE-family HTH domain